MSTKMNPLKTVCAYIRVSTHMQEELSPDAQLRLLHEYAGKNQMIIGRVYQDLGCSGTRAEKRPGFQEMIADCRSKEHPYSAVLVWKFSRFARNQEESIVYKSLLKKEQIDVVSISEPLPDGFIGALVERIFEWMDEYYSIRLSGEVKRGMTQKAIQGGYQGKMPLGYTKEMKKTPVVKPEEALIVQKIFNDYITKHGNSSDVAICLNREGIHAKEGGVFDAKKINYIITNPFYIGKIRWNYWNRSTRQFNTGNDIIIADGTHEPIITEEIWNQAQAIYYENKDKYKMRGNRRGSSGRKHWLSGLLRCGKCGGPMTYGVQSGSKHPFSFFQCSRRSQGRCDTSSYISEKNAVASVTAALKNILDTKSIEYEKIPAQAQDTKSLELLQTELTKTVTQGKRIQEAYACGIDSLEEYREHKKTLAERKAYLEQKIQLLSCQNNTGTMQQEERVCQSMEHILELLEQDSEHYTELGIALSEYIEKIEYNKSKNHMDVYLY